MLRTNEIVLVARGTAIVKICSHSFMRFGKPTRILRFSLLCLSQSKMKRIVERSLSDVVGPIAKWCLSLSLTFARFLAHWRYAFRLHLHVPLFSQRTSVIQFQVKLLHYFNCCINFSLSTIPFPCNSFLFIFYSVVFPFHLVHFRLRLVFFTAFRSSKFQYMRIKFLSKTYCMNIIS